ncbi:MAG: YggS family pyridoxal phosphate-dependent enzyme [Bryobacteraceae bacterium]
MLRENIASVEERIARACARAGRRREEITLLAVTKRFSPAVMIEAFEAGLRDFGENYVQEFEGKAPALTGIEGARFHLIGRLQSNKSRRAAELFDAIQTVDSEKLARRLGVVAGELRKTLAVMIEVKLSAEEAKHGAAAESLNELAAAIRATPGLCLGGLMTMPPWSEDPEAPRPYFARLRELAQPLGVTQLSMGMSNDFETAIEEGATHIRVGTALFGRRPKP